MNGLNHINYLSPIAIGGGSFVYEDGDLQYLLTSEGRVVFNPDGTHDYQYLLKDHLGNTRVTFGEDGIIQEDSYYPFGMTMAGLSHQTGQDLPNKYLYNGKELQDDFGLDWYDYGARFYDPALGRFAIQDRFSEKYYSLTNYGYAANNPVLMIDFNGDSLWINYYGNNILYNNGKIYNNDGTAYSGKGVKKNGKLKGFLKHTVNALNEINSTDAGSEMISELQTSKNNFTIKHASMHPNGYGNEFIENNTAKAYALQLQTDPSYSSSSASYLSMGIDISGGAGGSIYWDPNGYSLNTTQGIATNSTTDLAHEMFHGLDANRGTLDSRTYLDIRVSRSEWSAVYGENMVRSQLKLPLRTHFLTAKDPSGNATGGAGPRMIAPGNRPFLPMYPIKPKY